MIKYRPQRGSLAESISESKEFNTLDEMYDYIISEWNNIGELISKEDIYISENFSKDNRTDWIENRYVCLNRLGTLRFETPSCIGMCSIE